MQELKDRVMMWLIEQWLEHDHLLAGTLEVFAEQFGMDTDTMEIVLKELRSEDAITTAKDPDGEINYLLPPEFTNPLTRSYLLAMRDSLGRNQ